MIKCKWAGDSGDEYCKSCDGCTMEVDGQSISCDQCAGYEAGTEEIKDNEPIMTESVEELKNETPTNNKQKSTQKSKDPENPNNNTSKQEKSKIEAKDKETNSKNDITKIADEKKSEEKTIITNNGAVKVTSIRYTSGATIKKGDNYFKFIAEEEWDVSQVQNIEDTREMLWAKLNAQVDSQIEELKNM